MRTIEELRAALEAYRNGQRDLPTYEELAELAEAN